MTLLSNARKTAIGLAATLAFGLVAAPVAAQGIESIDPDTVIDGDLVEEPGEQPVYAEPTDDWEAGEPIPAPQTDGNQPSVGTWDDVLAPEWSDPVVTSDDPSAAATQAAGNPEVAAAQGQTYKEDDLIGAAEGVFGKGAEGLARLIQDVLKKQGEPNAYIVGREGGGAFVFGVRYGSGTMYHAVEGEMPVYWTGPSIGFDVGANAANTFVLVYNLFDSEDLYRRYPAGEGQAYAIGGMNASYLRRGNIVMIPIRVGAGARLGINAGYMKFSKKQKWLPF